MNRSSRKKRKAEQTENDASSTAHMSLGLFAPFRELGLVTNHVPFVLQLHAVKGAATPSQVNLITCIGRTWAMWSGESLQLTFIGSEAPDPISSLTCQNGIVWAASGSSMIGYTRGRQTVRFTNPLSTPISEVLHCGDNMLCITGDGRHLLVWDTNSEEFLGYVTFDATFKATKILHPATYLNKVLVTDTIGQLQLWNFQTKSCIYRFESSKLRDSARNHDPITALAQSPAIDVLGVGFQSGEISIYDVRADERLIRLFMENGGVRALAFRLDGEPILASASENGHMALWTLEKGGRLLHVIHGAHDGGITSLQWVPGQPLLVSSGVDNAIKEWLFDSATAPPRLLRFRAGHRRPPHLIRYYGEDGKSILSASDDRSLRNTSVVRDSRSHELSQGSLAKLATTRDVSIEALKYPPVASLHFSNARSKDWEDVITTHAKDPFARTWHVQNKRAGRWRFRLPDIRDDQGTKSPVATAAAVSACGNFSAVGSDSGEVRMWNMQSGLEKRAFPLPPSKPSARDDIATLSDKSVRGLATDALNRVLIVAVDKVLSFFDFHTAELVASVELHFSIGSMQLDRGSSLLVLTGHDDKVRMLDVETRRVVREFVGGGFKVIDFTLSPDSRWLITTSEDAVIRTFDVPSGNLIDGFRTQSVATSVAFSPTADFLATSHADSVGISLWANRGQYTEVSLKSISESDIPSVAVPGAGGISERDEDPHITTLSFEDSTLYESPFQLASDLMTLSLIPRSKWQTLLNIETIQQRNKPKEPPKAPANAPFFIPTVPGVDHRLDVERGDAPPLQERSSGALVATTELVRLMRSELTSSEYPRTFERMKTMSPAHSDAEIRALSQPEDLALFIHAINQRLKTNGDFEAVQTALNVFLRIHGQAVTANDELLPQLNRLLDDLRQSVVRLSDLISSTLGTVLFVRDQM